MAGDCVPDWISKSLSHEQLQPFKRKTQNAAILAAAGSGKTRTLVHLVAADLAAGIPPSEIIAFTFTEKAAEELLARIHALVARRMPEVDLGGMYIGTIHSWCLQYLRNQSDYYNFQSVDELHVDALVSRLYDTLGIEKTYGLPYPKGVEKFLADLEVVYNEHLAMDRVPPSIRPSVSSFITLLQQNRLMTFGQMIRAATNHLKANGPIPDLGAVYVDEYQDVNPAQVELVHAMAPQKAKIVGVGDDLQCIYNWRGSDVTRILNFTKEFKDASVFRLPTNYRSRPAIVTTANRVADRIVLKDAEKEMRPGRADLPYPTVHWLSFPTDDEHEKGVDAQALAAVEIVQRFASNGVPWNRMAILLRSVNSWGQGFVDAFTAAGIPVICPTLSKGGKFITEVVVPVLAWLRREHAEPRNEREEKEAEDAADALWASVKPWVNVSTKPASVFWNALNEWLGKVSAQRSDAYDVRGRFYDFLNSCNIRISPSDSSLMVGLGIASQIIRSVEEMHRRRIAGHSRRTPRGVISEVYHALIRRQKDFGESIPIEQIGDGVLISTIHQAKGLEWPVVILPMLVERRFPVSPKGHGTHFPPEIAARYGTSNEDERRLFYVATTRAKERLFLLDPMLASPNRRSSFVRDLEARGLVLTKSIADIDARIWKIDDEDLKAGGEPPMRIGLSDLLLYIDCGFQYGLRKVVGIEPSIGDELGYGQSLHELIQRRLEGGKKWSESELQAACGKHVFLPYMSETGESKSRDAIANRVRELETLGLLSGNVETEIDVDVVLSGGIVTGIIDLVVVNDDGSLLVRDWKSSLHDEFLPRYERQLQFYAFALRQQGRDVRRADIVDVKKSAKEGRLVTKEVDVSEKATSALIETLNAAIEDIASETYPARPATAVCQTCDQHRTCAERVGT